MTSKQLMPYLPGCHQTQNIRQEKTQTCSTHAYGNETTPCNILSTLTGSQSDFFAEQRTVRLNLIKKAAMIQCFLLALRINIQ